MRRRCDDRQGSERSREIRRARELLGAVLGALFCLAVICAPAVGQSQGYLGHTAGDSLMADGPGLLADGPGLSERPARRAARIDATAEKNHTSAADWLGSLGLSLQQPRATASDGTSLDSSLGFVGDAFAVADHVEAVSPTEDLDSASIAYNPARAEYLVVWHAAIRETAVDIYGRRLSASGAPIGNTFVISQAPSVQAVPHVAYEASSGTYWVTWSDFRTGSTPDVMIRRVSATGQLLGAEIMANGGPNQAFASRIACGSGRCVATWQNVEPDGDSHILIQGYEASGATFAPTLLLTDPVGTAAEPDICFNSYNNHFAVSWQQKSNGTGWDVWMFRLTRDLAGIERKTVSTASGNQLLPRITYGRGANRYLLVWQDARSEQSWDVYGQRVGRDGALHGPALAIYSGAYHDVRPIAAGHSIASEFVVAFQRDISGAQQFQIYGSRVTGNGTIGQTFPIRLWYNIRWTPAIAHRTNTSDYIAAWTDYGTAIQNDIQAQRFSSNGNMVGSLANVSLGRKGQETPAAAYNTVRNEYLTVWADYRSGNDYDLYARRVSPSGELLGQELMLASVAFLYGVPEIVYNPNVDEYLVVWAEVTSPQTGYEIYGRRLSGLGGLRGSAFHVSRDTNTVNEGMPVVAYNSVAREYLVAWHAFTSSRTARRPRWRIWGQLVSESGQLTGSNFIVSGSDKDTQASRIVHNPSRDEYVVVWLDWRNDQGDVYGHRLTGSGARAGDDLAISTASGTKGRCDIDYNATDRNYLVVWGDTRNPTSDVYGQMLDSVANLSGPNFPIAALSGVSEFAPLVSWDPISNDFLVAWWGFYGQTDTDIWACTVSGTGTDVGDWTAVTQALEVQRGAKLSRGAVNGVVLIVWQDFRNGNYDIYGRLWEATTGCRANAATLCLNNDRFSVEVAWKDFEGKTGTGTAVPLTGDTGYFWFFNSSNVELVVKVLDGSELNGFFWVFYGALSNVEYTMTVTDIETGNSKTYHNPSGNFASAGDTEALPGGDGSVLAAPSHVDHYASSVHTQVAELLNAFLLPEEALAVSAAVGSCTADGTTLCLNNNRFSVTVAWKDFQGNAGVGTAAPLTGDTGFFWFFNSSNVELVVKVLDGSGLNGHFWVFYGALSNVEYTITLTDTVTGAVKQYVNPSGNFGSVGDIEAFPTP